MDPDSEKETHSWVTSFEGMEQNLFGVDIELSILKY